MPTTSSSPYISGILPDAVSTNVDTQSPVTPDHEQEPAAQRAWQELIDHTLIEWGRDPGQISDEGISPPAADTIRAAIELAQAFKEAGFPAPDSVVPDPNGGIVFERREGSVSEVFHVWDDGNIEYRCFDGTRLVERRTL